MARSALSTLYGRSQDRYLELVLAFPLRPIRTEPELDEATRVIHSLIDLDKRSAYETEHYPDEPAGTDADMPVRRRRRCSVKSHPVELEHLSGGFAMVVLYSAGRRIGTWAEAEKLFADAAKAGPIEFRDEAGAVLARTAPAEPICPWDPTLTAEELDRRSAQGGGIPLKEFWQRMSVE